MRMTTTIAAALCAAALLASGCGGGDGDTDADEPAPTAEPSKATPAASEGPAFTEADVDAVIQPNASTPYEAVLTLVPDDEGNLVVSRFQ